MPNKSLLCRSLLLNATTKICCQLLLVLLANLRSTSKNYQDTLMGSLSLVLYAIEILKTKRNGSHNSGPELKKVCEQINKWILKQFTSPFEIQSQHFHGKQNLQEMMVCTNNYDNYILHHKTISIKCVYHKNIYISIKRAVNLYRQCKDDGVQQ